MSILRGKWGFYISCVNPWVRGFLLEKSEEGISFHREGSDYDGTGHLITKFMDFLYGL